MELRTPGPGKYVASSLVSWPSILVVDENIDILRTWECDYDNGKDGKKDGKKCHDSSCRKA